MHAIAAIKEDASGTFAVAMTREEQTRFVTGMSGDVEGAYLDMLGRVDSEASECSRPSDQRSIHAAIRDTVGFGKLNRMLFDVMEGWVEGQLRERAGVQMAEGNVLEAMDCNRSLASFLKQQGKYDAALVLEKQILEVYERNLNASDAAIGNQRANADCVCAVILCRVRDVQSLHDVLPSRQTAGGSGAAGEGTPLPASRVGRK